MQREQHVHGPEYCCAICGCCVKCGIVVPLPSTTTLVQRRAFCRLWRSASVNSKMQREERDYNSGLPPQPPDTPAVDAEYAEYLHRGPLVWPPPTARLRYKAMDDYYANGVAMLERHTVPHAPHVRLSGEEFCDWINERKYGGKRKALYVQHRRLLNAMWDVRAPD